MRPQISILLKTYSKDREYVDRLIPSFLKHNVEKLTLYVVCEEGFASYFDQFSSDQIIVLDERIFGSLLFAENEIPNSGYLNQAIIKLAFGLMNLCDNYFTVDSDTVFVKDFGERSFLSSEGRPFLVVAEDRDLCVDPDYYLRHWEDRNKSIGEIAKILKFRTETGFFPTCHGHQVFSTSSIVKLDEYLAIHGLNFKKAIQISGYEFSWYTLFVQVWDQDSYVRSEPIIWTAHSAELLATCLIRGVKIQHLSRAYVGVCVNSNYGRFAGALGYEDWGKNLVSWTLILRALKVAGRLCIRKMSLFLFLRRLLSFLRRNRQDRAMRA